MYDTNASDRDTVIPMFYREAFLNKRKTKENGGVPVYIETEMVKIFIPGSRDTVERPVEEVDKTRWPTQYAAFKLNQEQPLNGTPIEEFATATEAERAMMRGAKVRTVEQMANFPDGQLARVGVGAVRLRDKAKLFLETQAKVSQTAKLMAEIEALRAQIEEMKNGNTVKPVSERNEGDGVPGPLDNSVKRKPGRPKAARPDTSGGGLPGEAA